MPIDWREHIVSTPDVLTASRGLKGIESLSVLSLDI